nr:response regulator [uncultured Rhodopila sp.]
MNQKCLLLVEDEYDLRLTMAECLSAAGFKVVEAEDGDHAVRILERHPQIDLLVTDIDIPGRYDGNDVAISAKAWHFDLPVVYASGSPERLTNTVGPSDAFLLKPFRQSEMIAVILRLLAGTKTPGLRSPHDYSEPVPANPAH